MDSLTKFQFSRVVRYGKKLKYKGIIFWFIESQGLKISVWVYGKFKNKVQKNRVKRRVKEAVRRNISVFPQNRWIVLLAPSDFLQIEFEEIEKRIKKIAEIVGKSN